MSRKPRKVRPVDKDKPADYDSKWEQTLHKTILQDWNHHEGTIAYTVSHIYHPDFVRTIKGKKILLESKGRFWDYSEFSKYIWIKKALPDDVELVFLFANSSAPMPQAKRRKDGTKRSHGEWATDNDFRWYTEESLPDSWRSEYDEEQ